ncbi:MAG: PglZ domain-containing protein [Bacteroidales bacterium]|nr:PglZ domain-containing protein [Bacteroidales bacterium]
MTKTKILWVDDEIDLLKPHVMFLEHKGFLVETANNGAEALEMIQESMYDVVLLDENMPGLSGLEVLTKMNETNPTLPVVMITKSEEEHIMNDALGSNIFDYLIKPVNPNQILLSLKKIVENKELIRKKQLLTYQQNFRTISMDIMNASTMQEWMDIYKKLTYWDIELDKISDENIGQIIQEQKDEANRSFCKFYSKNYIDWLQPECENRPEMSHTILKNKLIHNISSDSPTFLIVIDNLRYDQWKVLEPVLSNYFRVEEDSLYCAILPTATHYARNALFAGMLPSEIKKKYPEYWVEESSEENKNQHESSLFAENLKRYGKNVKFHYAKVLNQEFGKKMVDNLNQYLHHPINVVIFNFIDMLSHARTDVEIVRELAPDESAYRSVTVSWFEHSPLFDLLKKLAEKNVSVVITADHGSIRVNNPVRIMGDKSTNSNLRYKVGKTLGGFNPKEVFEIQNPAKAFLPQENLSSTFVFCRSNDFFAYPNNYNYYVNYYKNTFQHGGISMEEVLIPYIKLKPR